MLMMVVRVAMRLLADQAGSNAIEYGLVFALVSLAVVTGAGVAGSAMEGMFMAIGAVYSAATASIATL
ncbi:MAG TPA: Flp family type IVb pilin [Aliidongia sp.]|nr:Flp family type IVb pilin [Aliidongia sp.]